MKRKELKEAIYDTEQEIEAIEKKLFRSQTMLLMALLDGKTPDKTEVDFFKMYASLIEHDRRQLVAYNEELNKRKKKDE